MTDTVEGEPAYRFLSGGGEMGARMRSHPWIATPLGVPAGWPQSLRAILSVCLHSPTPSAVLWGRDLRMFYNDAYMAALLDSGPVALGRPAAEIWRGTWSGVAQAFSDALKSGGIITAKAVQVPIMRDGRPELTYWDTSTTPIRGEDDEIVGLFSQGFEITERVVADRAARESEERLQQALSAGNGVGTWDWNVLTDQVRSDARFARLYGVPPEIAMAGAPIATFFGRVHPEDLDRVKATIAEAVRIGAPFAEEYRLLEDDGGVRWVIARGQCEHREDGTPIRFPGVSFDITARKRTEVYQAALLELSDRLQQFGTTDDPGEIVLAASDVLGRTLGVEQAGYGGVDLAAETVSIERDWHAPGVRSLAGIHRFRDYGSHIDDLRRGETVVIGDVDTDIRTRAYADHLKATGIHALINLPVIEQGQIVAVIYATMSRPRPWEAEDIALMREVADRIRAATERVRSERDLRLALSAGRFGPWRLDLVTGMLDASPICRKAYGRAPNADFTYQDLTDSIHPDDRARRQRVQDKCIATGEDYDIEYRILTPAGDTRWVAVRARATYFEDGRARVLTGITSDITARKRMEEALGAQNADLERRVEERTADLVKAQEALRQSQKMESVGQLTGGIAHDFNNLLQGITGSLQIARRRIAKGRIDDIDRFLDGAITSADRATALTHRLLAFSRRQPLDPRPVAANGLVVSLEELFRRTIGAAIDLRIVPAGDLWDTFCDPNQLESSLLNLVINARDAMPTGGILTIETCNVHIDTPSTTGQRPLQPGHYVCIEVSDTGSGMSPDTIERAFEPFFTTKPIGQGTGLGLSMVYGFAGQSEGHVSIYSEAGVGTTIKLYLPRHLGTRGEEDPAAAEHAVRPAGDGETVLVIEDEVFVRELILDVLREHGYHALEAGDGPAGLAIVRSEARIDLLVTDIGLPGLDGREVAAAARAERPSLKVLFMTGYAKNAALASGFLESGMGLITKPFAMDALAARVREMIEAQ